MKETAVIELPDDVKAILDQPVYVHLSTNGGNGYPHTTAMWVERHGDRVAFSTVEGRVKHRNALADPKVAISFTDPGNAYKAVMIQGDVVDITRDDAEPMIDRMANRYLGTDYEWRQPGQVRVVLMIEATNVT